MDSKESLQSEIQQLRKNIDLLIKVIKIKDRTINRLLDCYILKK